MKDNRKKILISLLIVIVFSMLSISIYYWYQNMHYVSTDDARITGDLVKISPKGTGKLIPKFYVVLRKPLKIDIFAEPTKNSSSYSYILTLFTPLPQHI